MLWNNEWGSLFFHVHEKIDSGTQQAQAFFNIGIPLCIPRPVSKSAASPKKMPAYTISANDNSDQQEQFWIIAKKYRYRNRGDCKRDRRHHYIGKGCKKRLKP